MQNELIELAKKCKSAEEILSLAKEKGMEMTEAEATNCFAMLNKQNGEMAEDELASVSAGANCLTKYNEDGYVQISPYDSGCALYEDNGKPFKLYHAGHCGCCVHCKDVVYEVNSNQGVGYCKARTKDNDPLFPAE